MYKLSLTGTQNTPVHTKSKGLTITCKGVQHFLIIKTTIRQSREASLLSQSLAVSFFFRKGKIRMGPKLWGYCLEFICYGKILL